MFPLSWIVLDECSWLDPDAAMVSAESCSSLSIGAVGLEEDCNYVREVELEE